VAWNSCAQPRTARLEAHGGRARGNLRGGQRPGDQEGGGERALHSEQRRVARRDRAQGAGHDDEERNRPEAVADALEGRDGLPPGNFEQVGWTSSPPGEIMPRHVIASTLVTLALAAPALAQPRIINGRLAPHTAGQGLDRTFRDLVTAQTEPAWIGYAVPITAGDRTMCCYGNGWMTSCGLEPPDTRGRIQDQPRTATIGPVRLEGPESMIVLYRVDEKAVQKIRTFTPDCELDAGGRTIHWLEGVAPADSIALLASLVSRDEQKRDRVTNGALAAISMHRDPSADSTLIRLARQDASAKVRGEAIFWLA